MRNSVMETILFTDGIIFWLRGSDDWHQQWRVSVCSRFESVSVVWSRSEDASDSSSQLDSLASLFLIFSSPLVWCAAWPTCWWELPCSWCAAPTAAWRRWAGCTSTCSGGPWTWSHAYLTSQVPRPMGDLAAPLHRWEIWTRMVSTVRTEVWCREKQIHHVKGRNSLVAWIKLTENVVVT